jgi:predicted Zn finger-like uncharacterized protein
MITQCPSCQTRFRLPLDQVATSRGEVLCGECRAQFNALDYLVIEDGIQTGKPTLTDRATRRDEREGGNTLFLPIDEEVIANLLSDGDASTQTVSTTAVSNSTGTNTVPSPQLIPITQSAVPDFTDTLIQQALQIDSEVDEATTTAKVPPPPEAVAVPEPETAPHQAASPSEPDPQESTKYQLNRELLTPSVAEPHGSLWSTLLSLLLASLLLSSLGLQYLISQREHFAQHRYFRPLLTTICPYLHCAIAPKRDLSLFSVVNTRIETHPQHPDALLINAELANNGRFEQLYPLVELVMTNIQQEVVASRKFYPDEYLLKFSRENPQRSASFTVEPIQFEVVDPGSHATGFEFILHNPVF